MNKIVLLSSILVLANSTMVQGDDSIKNNGTVNKTCATQSSIPKSTKGTMKGTTKTKTNTNTKTKKVCSNGSCSIVKIHKKYNGHPYPVKKKK